MNTKDANIQTLRDEEIITKPAVSRRSLFATSVLLLSAATVNLTSRKAAAAISNPTDPKTPSIADVDRPGDSKANTPWDSNETVPADGSDGTSAVDTD